MFKPWMALNYLVCLSFDHCHFIPIVLSAVLLAHSYSGLCRDNAHIHTFTLHTGNTGNQEATALFTCSRGTWEQQRAFLLANTFLIIQFICKYLMKWVYRKRSFRYRLYRPGHITHTELALEWDWLALQTAVFLLQCSLAALQGSVLGDELLVFGCLPLMDTEQVLVILSDAVTSGSSLLMLPLQNFSLCLQSLQLSLQGCVLSSQRRVLRSQRGVLYLNTKIKKFKKATIALCYLFK